MLRIYNFVSVTYHLRLIQVTISTRLVLVACLVGSWRSW